MGPGNEKQECDHAEGKEPSRHGPQEGPLGDEVEPEGRHLEEEEAVDSEIERGPPRAEDEVESQGESGPGVESRAALAEGEERPPGRPGVPGLLAAGQGEELME